MIPKLKLQSALENEVIYNQGDNAEEMYFIFDGTVLLYTDLSDIVTMNHFK